MNGNKQKLKSSAEYDLLYDKRNYCYLCNHSPSHKIKKQMSKRRRKESKLELCKIINEECLTLVQ